MNHLIYAAAQEHIADLQRDAEEQRIATLTRSCARGRRWRCWLRSGLALHPQRSRRPLPLGGISESEAS